MGPHNKPVIASSPFVMQILIQLVIHDCNYGIACAHMQARYTYSVFVCVCVRATAANEVQVEFIVTEFKFVNLQFAK